MFDLGTLPRLDEPAKVVSLTTVVAVVCQCGSPAVLGLLNNQKAVCETCGQVMHVTHVTWDASSSVPRVELALDAPSRQHQLSMS